MCDTMIFLYDNTKLTGFGSANMCDCDAATEAATFCVCCFVDESKSIFPDGFSKFISGNSKPSSSDFGERFL